MIDFFHQLDGWTQLGVAVGLISCSGTIAAVVAKLGIALFRASFRFGSNVGDVILRKLSERPKTAMALGVVAFLAWLFI